jgi:hypothetical protein
MVTGDRCTCALRWMSDAHALVAGMPPHGRRLTLRTIIAKPPMTINMPVKAPKNGPMSLMMSTRGVRESLCTMRTQVPLLVTPGTSLCSRAQRESQLRGLGGTAKARCMNGVWNYPAKSISSDPSR